MGTVAPVLRICGRAEGVGLPPDEDAAGDGHPCPALQFLIVHRRTAVAHPRG